MLILKEFQEKAVGQLLDHTFEALRETRNQNQILLDAPTGSGKTVMMAAYLERLTVELRLKPGLSSNVAFVWFAPNTLHIQSFNSLHKLYADTRKLNCIDLSYMGNNPELQQNDLLFVNWSKVDKEKNLWRKDNEMNANLESLLENTRNNGTEIILIIDEAHLSAFSGKQAIAVRNLINAKIEVSVTATPKIRTQMQVTVSRRVVIEQQMIKKGVKLNMGINPAKQNGEEVHIHLLQTALAKKDEIKKLYDAELGVDVLNPLILIQLPSDHAALSDLDKSIRESVEAQLAANFNITAQNGRLAVWLSGEKDTDDIEKMNGHQDVLIFKQAIAQGWDCPRACILVSYRPVRDANFGIQTVGRILRMAHHRHYKSDELNYGYVYTNIQTSQINLVPSDVDYFDLQYAKRRDDRGWVFNKLQNATIVNDRPTKGVLNSQFEQILFKVMEENFGIIQLPEVDMFSEERPEDYLAQLTFNKTAFEQKGWEFTIDINQIRIPADVEIDPYEVNTIQLENDQVKSFAITIAAFSETFARFCYENITRFNKSKSWSKLRSTLIHFAEYYLGMFETTAIKFYLYPQNKALLIPIIAHALESFDQWQKEKGNINRRLVIKDWEVPEFRYYNNLHNKKEEVNHALDPFYEWHNASSPEVEFRKFLNKHSQHLEWWYKNGDQGQEHFAVPYGSSQKELRLFFVDFVVKFKNGIIGLFDTKTQRSDYEAPFKHNALIAYIEKENATNKERKLIGGVLIPQETSGVISFRYCRNRINDTNDLTGWDFLDPALVSNS